MTAMTGKKTCCKNKVQSNDKQMNQTKKETKATKKLL